MDDDGPAGNDGVDRISALPDDLLHVILSRLRRAVFVPRTAALSRRWRRVWVHARDLSLADFERGCYDLLSDAAQQAFAGFVDWVLAQRGDADADAGDMDSLRISIRVADAASPDQINAWIRYGTERVAGDFYLLYCYEVTAARVVAPRLEEIDLCRISLYSGRRPDLEIHGLASVRRLSEIQLDVHAHYYSCDTIFSFWLLENCPGVQDFEVYLGHGNHEYHTVEEFADLTLEGAARFPNVRSMFVEAKCISERHLVGRIVGFPSEVPWPEVIAHQDH